MNPIRGKFLKRPKYILFIHPSIHALSHIHRIKYFTLRYHHENELITYIKTNKKYITRFFKLFVNMGKWCII